MDRAYSDKNNTLLLLNFEDKLKRVNDSTRIDFRLNDEPGNPLISTATQSIKTDGGKTYGFLDIVSKLGIENRKSKLTIDKIYLDVEEKQKETGIKISTLSNIFKYIDENFDGEDNSVIWPQSSYVLACKEFEGLYFLDIQIFKNNFLCIQAFNNRTFGDIEREDLDIRLMNKKGEILTADFGMTEFSGSIDSENSLSKYYFKFDDLESIKDYEIVISYTEASNILTGNWSFDFDLNQTYDSYKVELNEVIHTKNGDIKLLSITKSKYSIILEYDESEYKSKNGANIMAEILDNGEPISKFGYYNSYTNRTLIKQFISLSKEPKNGIMSISVGNEQDLLVIKFNEIFKYNNV